jgi:hypothetical protein
MQKHHKLSLFFLLLVTVLSAQGPGVPKEVGIQIRGINFNGVTSFSAFYKKQKAENVFKRYSFIVGNIDFQDAADRKSSLTLNAGLAVGREKRRSLDRKLVFYRGPEFRFNINLASNEVIFSNNFPGTVVIQRSSYNFGVGFGYVVGLQHNFNDLWAINLETIPSVRVNANFFSDSDTAVSAGAGLSNIVSLGIVRRF